MVKTWTSTENGNDKIIGIGHQKLYKANPVHDEMSTIVNQINNDIPSNYILSIPFSYIRSVQLEKSTNYIQVNFGHESEELFRIRDDQKRFEIFKYFRDNIPVLQYQLEKYSVLKAIRKPLIATSVVLVLYLWTMYYVIQISNGTEYELIGNGASLSGIVFSLAQLGIEKVNLIFGILILIGAYSAVRKGKNPPEIHGLVRSKK
jgi:hypothetical protein